MEVIVDDSQLSLAIGKKGQNVRLAAKLLGWKIDIKSEEEKRQEVESAMAALVVPGAPVSVLIDYGLAETRGRKTGGSRHRAPIEKLGAMTPEQLEEIPGIGAEMVEKIQDGGEQRTTASSKSPASERCGGPEAAPQRRRRAGVGTAEVAAEAESGTEPIEDRRPTAEPEARRQRSGAVGSRSERRDRRGELRS